MNVKHFYKKVLSILLTVCLSMSIAPISALAEGADAVCKIGDDEYTNLDLALDAIGEGESKTIELLADIYYDQGMVIEDKSVTFALNEYELKVNNNSGVGLRVTNGTVEYTGEGEFNVTGTTAGAYVNHVNSVATVTNVEGINYGVNASIGKITVNGNVVGAVVGAVATNSGEVTIKGNVRALNEDGTGAKANPNSKLIIDGMIDAKNYIKIGEAVKNKGEGTSDSDNPGYLKYGGSSDGIVWVLDTVCAIGEKKYANLNDALADIPTGREEPTIISLLKSIDYNQSIVLDNKQISFELNGFILNVYSEDEDHPALEVINGGRVVLSGEGELNIKGKNYGVFVSSETTPSAVTITSAEATAAGGTAAYADGRVSITVLEDVYSFQNGGYGAIAYDTAYIHIKGEAIATGTGVEAGAATIYVEGSISAGQLGANVLNNGNITIDGEIDAHTYIMVDDITKIKGDGVPDTEPGYLLYSGSGTDSSVRVKATTFALTVNSGSGTGEYAEGANVILTAATPAEDKLFDKWVITSGTLDLDDATANPIVITMPTEAIIIEATYKDKQADPTYTVTLNDGGTGATGAGSYTEGTIINIYAGNRSGYTFTGWTSSDVAITNGSNKNASFTMPGKAVAVTANWSYNGGGGSGSNPGSGGGSGGGSDNGSDNGSDITVTPPSSDRPNAPTQVEIKVEAKLSNGNATLNITEKDVADAFDKAIADAKKSGNESNGITLVLKVKAGKKNVKSITISLSKAVQEFIISKKIANIVIATDNPGVTISTDLTAWKEINKRAGTDVNITATRMDNSDIRGSAKTAIGSRPVFDFKVSYGSGNTVHNFGAGSVSVAIPYTLGVNEKAGNVQAVYVDASGKVQWLISSVYDSLDMVLRFSSNHFSTYGVGYKQNAPSFTDINTHWAKDDIQFVINRGLFSSTSKSTFSPNAVMTRGMFVTALGRLANADVSDYKQSSFTDVENDAYYMGYIEWASKNGIVNGVGNGKFAPDQSIIREQMPVIISNYTKTIGYTLPKVHVENTFADNAKISTYAKEAVKQMQMAGVIRSKNGNLFDPQGTATRAEVSAVLRRFVELAISSDTAQGWTMNDSGRWMYYENGNFITGKKDINGSTYTFDQYGVTEDVPKVKRYTTYTAQKGDSFWLIAHKLGYTTNELERLNNKSRFSLIHPGDVLRVPEK